jgi:hypothetical protein
VLYVVVGGIAVLAGLAAVDAWAKRIGRSRSEWHFIVKVMRLAITIAVGMLLLGAISTVIKTYGAASNADPARKATLLADGISGALNCVIRAGFLTLMSAGVFLVLQLVLIGRRRT